MERRTLFAQIQQRLEKLSGFLFFTVLIVLPSP